MRILIIDNNIDPDSWGAPDLRRVAALVPGALVTTRRAPQGDLPAGPEGFDRIVVSGSKTSALEDAPWISELHRFIKRSIDLGKPLLGVCYGHQALIRAIGGKQTVRKSAEPEFGWTLIECLETSPLTRGLPEKFHSFSAHFEEVAKLPQGFRRLARSKACEIQACQLEDKPVYGIQFHPERDARGAEQTFASRRKLGTPKKLLHPGESEKLYDQKTSDRIFLNFFES